MTDTTGDLVTGPGESASLAAMGYKQELKRALSFWDLIVFGLICISPTAPTAIFGFVYNKSHGMPALAYVVGLVAMLFTALSYMTMSRAFPVAGSAYAFAGRSIGVSAGFIAGWAILLDYLLVPTLCYVVAAAAIHAIAPAVPRVLLVVVFLVAVTATNLLGVESSNRFNKVMLWVQLAVLVGFVAFAGIALSHGVGGAHFSTAPVWQPGVVTAPLIFSAISVAALSFLGFDAISTLSEEVKGGPRSVGRATVLSLVIAAGLFVLQTWLASLFVLGKPAFAAGEASDTAFLGIVGTISGPWFKGVMSIVGIALGSIACALVAQAACARLIYGMARDGKLPRWFAHVNGGRQTPERATVLIALITLVTGLFAVDKIEEMSSLVNFGALTAFLFVHLSVLVHFGLKSGRNWFLHVLSPILGLGIIGYVMWNMDHKAQILGASWLAIGLVVMLILKLRKQPLDVPVA
ncbi:MAG TPA: APC family permease [Caulobacteraceae bacterium]|jgi:amino acid transporter